MNKKQYIGLIILAVAIFGVMFYWYSLRPSIIKKDCYKEAMKDTQPFLPSLKISDIMNSQMRKIDDDFNKHFNRSYSRCLERNGL